LSFIWVGQWKKKKNKTCSQARWYNWLNVRLTVQIRTFPHYLRNENTSWLVILIRFGRLEVIQPPWMWSGLILKRASASCGVCVEMCVILCYFKKTAWREEIELSVFKELFSVIEVISHTSHSMWYIFTTEILLMTYFSL
jgi:hypothetical protein